MRKYIIFSISFLSFSLFMALGKSYGLEKHSIQVIIKSPRGTLRMGDTPYFVGLIRNSSNQVVKDLAVYLSLVSLEPGHVHPMDLEDWSAQKAIRVNQLQPAETRVHKWNIRLIQSGRFAVTLTVVNPKVKRPMVSELVSFNIEPKPMLNSRLIFPVAIGELLLLLAVFLLTHWVYIRFHDLEKF